ncbi:plasmid mobilization relaxosome protein MobC [Flavobacterium plurextorum]|uniref:plasmid mobilization protein n=1 Tax=Flavobacterium TaxID=237 RepID=UPI00214D278C|nr:MULTISPECIES: plasmid mobilization relaxosome protein MobC [Flavobacterium]UUW08651.1 plasmid mobilization relaxosome protein MobC [Flavobacterium plurextorum]
MEQKNYSRNRWLHIRLTEVELQQVDKNFKASVYRKRSAFVRRNLLRKPVVMKYRNESLDELIQQLIQLRTQLNFIGNNFNQSVKKLHTLIEISDFRQWIESFESDKKKYFSIAEEIKKHIENISQKWLQS